MYKLSQYIVTQEFSYLDDKLAKVVLLSTRSLAIKVLDKNTFLYLVDKKFELLDLVSLKF